MTWEEIDDTPGYNVAGFITVLAAFICNLLNGTMLKVFPDFKLPEMNINDILTIVLSVIAGVYTCVKIYHEILKIIDKRYEMREKRFLDKKFKRRVESIEHDSSRGKPEEENGMGSPEKH